jgi:hypothetical protein
VKIKQTSKGKTSEDKTNKNKIRNEKTSEGKTSNDTTNKHKKQR